MGLHLRLRAFFAKWRTSVAGVLGALRPADCSKTCTRVVSAATSASARSRNSFCSCRYDAVVDVMSGIEPCKHHTPFQS